jgi:uncharacterized membrane protein YdjX (TVP38/TMEM64 family)
MVWLALAGAFLLLGLSPVWMPPAWLVAAYARAEYDLEVVPLVALALGALTLGRLALVAGARAAGPRVLPARARANTDYLAERLRGTRSRLGALAVLAAAPPPAGAWYVAAGLVRIALPLVVIAVVVGRLPWLAFGAVAGGAVAGGVSELVGRAVGPWSIALGVGLLALVVWLLGRIDWRRLVERIERKADA